MSISDKDAYALALRAEKAEHEVNRLLAENKVFYDTLRIFIGTDGIKQLLENDFRPIERFGHRIFPRSCRNCKNRTDHVEGFQGCKIDKKRACLYGANGGLSTDYWESDAPYQPVSDDYKPAENPEERWCGNCGTTPCRAEDCAMLHENYWTPKN